MLVRATTNQGAGLELLSGSATDVFSNFTMSAGLAAARVTSKLKPTVAELLDALLGQRGRRGAQDVGKWLSHEVAPSLTAAGLKAAQSASEVGSLRRDFRRDGASSSWLRGFWVLAAVGGRRLPVGAVQARAQLLAPGV